MIIKLFCFFISKLKTIDLKLDLLNLKLKVFDLKFQFLSFQDQVESFNFPGTANLHFEQYCTVYDNYG